VVSERMVHKGEMTSPPECSTRHCPLLLQCLMSERVHRDKRAELQPDI
jgi:hypothetical protein